MINLLSAQAEIDAAADYAAVLRVLYRVDHAERLLAAEMALEDSLNALVLARTSRHDLHLSTRQRLL